MSRIQSVLPLVLLAAWVGGGSLRAQSTSAASKAAGNRVISGMVLSTKTGRPLDEADVTLWNTLGQRLVAETTSDEEGRFTFSQLADGNFMLRASHRGYIAAAFEEHEGAFTGIVTGESLVSTGLRFTLAPQAVISGTIADESGDPAPQAQVSLYRQNHRSGTGKLVRANVTIADALGNFEFPRLAPGSYYVVVVARPWYARRPQRRGDMQGNVSGDRPRSPLDVAYPVTYYPDVTESSAASPISVDAGDHIPIAITLHPVPTIHISMQVPSAGLNQPMVMPQLRQDIFGTSDILQTNVSFISLGNRQDENSITSVEIQGVAPGHYDVELNAPSGESGRFTSIDANSDHSNIDISSAATMADVSGRVVIANPGNLTSELFLSLSSLQSSDVIGTGVGVDGSFHFQPVRPGTYEVVASAGGSAMAVTHLTASGGSVDGSLLKVGNEPVTLTATVTESTATVNGFTQLDGKPAPGVLVVLIPERPIAGNEAGSLNQSDSNGSFNFPHVPPGEYTLVSIQDGWTLDWGRPEVIAHYLAKGLKVTVTAHSQEIHLKDPLKVQPK